jgi:glyoxylase-like metal-dependent hydrolase (beta-lactamase superfamily II)
MPKLTRRDTLVAAFSAMRLHTKPQVAGLDRGFASAREVAAGVHATIADNSKGLQCGSNGGVIVGRDAVLIVEGHFQPEGAAFEIEVARSVAKAPIRAAVVTHFHFDHSFGVSAYADQRIPVMAHPGVTPLMKQQYTAIQGVDKAALLAPLREKVDNAVDATDRARKQADLEKTKLMYSSIDAARISYPTEPLPTTELPKRIELGGITAVIEYHPGHTSTDLIIRIPERNVIFAGDLLFVGAYGVAVDADMVAWRKVLADFSAYDITTKFIPGHGPVCGLTTVREQAAVMDDLRAHAEKMIRIGVDSHEAERRYVVPKAFQHFRISAWGWTIAPALRSFYASLLHKA